MTTNPNIELSLFNDTFNILVDPANQNSTTQNQNQPENTETAEIINLNQGVPNLYVESTSKLDELLLAFQKNSHEFHNFDKVTLDKLVKFTKDWEHFKASFPKFVS
ncbi:unnamed protein product [Allacma fusca]|uniref:Uncharacterized protein n=1 Tax=Allacma fusca TaxID=39272 RepID=A0A8J2PRC5_9HEXA|nr:unnamed protein product [Allacma fusca]